MDMRGLAITLLLVVLVGMMAGMSSAATIAVDVSHGEGTVALVTPIIDPTTGKMVSNGIVNALSWYTWGYIGSSSELEGKMEQLGGSITPESLKNVDMLIIGQLKKPLSPEEVSAVVSWFSEGGKILWISGDADIGEGAYIQKNADDLLKAIPNVHLRLDYATATDTFSNAGKDIYVAGYVRPDLNTPDSKVLLRGYTSEVGKVLFYTSGVLAWVDNSGQWHPLRVGEVPKGVYRIITTSGDGVIEDNSAPEPMAYKVWESGMFTLLAAEFVKLPNGGESILILSGESPYGSPVPISVNRFGPYVFDGEHFVENLVTWAFQEARSFTPTTSSPSRTSTTPTPTNTSTPLSSTSHPSYTPTTTEPVVSPSHTTPLTTSTKEKPGLGWKPIMGLTVMVVILAVLVVFFVRKVE